MKRSRNIGLLVLGTAALLAGCSGDGSNDIQQQSYASKADCERDWKDSKQPQQQQSLCSPSGHGSGYFGPRYFWNRSSGSPVAVLPDGSHRSMSDSAFARSPAALAHMSSHSSGSSHSVGSVSRGGFGSGGHAGSAGG